MGTIIKKEGDDIKRYSVGYIDDRGICFGARMVAELCGFKNPHDAYKRYCPMLFLEESRDSKNRMQAQMHTTLYGALAICNHKRVDSNPGKLLVSIALKALRRRFPGQRLPNNTVSDYAALLRNVLGFPITAHDIFVLLREKDYLHSDGANRNLPTDKANGLLAAVDMLSYLDANTRISHKKTYLTDIFQEQFVYDVIDFVFNKHEL